MIRLTLLSSLVFVMTQPMAAAFMMAPSSSSIVTRRIAQQISPSSSSSSQTSTSISISTTKLSMSKRPPPKSEKPKNEFSRPIRTDIILSPRSRRAYDQQISATETELSELATRFSLSKITNLEADLALSQDTSGSGSSSDGRRSRSDSSGGVIVKGDVKASVTQTCVRTNEDFEVELEFSIFSIVKPTELRESQQQQQQQGEADMTLGGLSLSQIEDQLHNSSGGGGGGRGNRRKGKNKKRGGNKSNGISKGNILNEMKMKEIESLLQEFDTEDDIFEDENVLASDGILDIGELVAQMFRLKLDPYPKKPGSEPVSYSISG